MATLFSLSIRRGKGGIFAPSVTMETGDKNHGDFHCMQISLVMSIWFIFGNRNNNNLKSRLSLIVQVNVVLNRTVVVDSD